MVVPLKWRQKLLASGTLITFVCAFAQGVDHAGPQFRKPINCEILTDGNYVWGCSRFYSVCANGQEHSQYCYTGLVFNPENNQCDLPNDTIPCQTAGDVNLYKSKLPFTCNGRPDGNYEAGVCQPQYFQCFHGNRNTLPCPKGLVFIPKDNSCDSEANCKKIVNGLVPVQARYIDQGLSPPPQPAVPPGYVSGQKSQPTTTQAPNPRQTRYGSNLQVTSPTKHDPSANGEDVPKEEDVPFDCSGKEDGVYLKSQSACTSVFYKCANERGLQYQCPFGLSYNVDNNQCDYDRFVIACGWTPPPTPDPTDLQPRKAIQAPKSRQTMYGSNLQVTLPTKRDPSVNGEDVPFDCSGKEDGVYLKSQTACTSVFYKCTNERVLQYQCPMGLSYNVDNNQCDYDRFVIACGWTPPPTPDPTDLQPRKAIQFDCRNKKDGLYANSTCSPVFFSCLAGHVAQINCAAGTVYDEVTRVCEFPQECGKTKSTTEAPKQGIPLEYQFRNDNFYMYWLFLCLCLCIIVYSSLTYYKVICLF